MREILFRGKSIENINNGEWVEGCFVKLDNDVYIVPILNETNLSTPVFLFLCGYVFRVDPNTVGQYTGLTDKNGNKIFEGDIVLPYLNWLRNRVNGVVRYESRIAKWVCDFVIDSRRESAFLADWVYGNGTEIIGNIHDTPELLNEVGK